MDKLTLEEAMGRLLCRTRRITETEEIPLWDAVGRILAEDVTAVRNQPPFPRSPLDGYAVRGADIKGASRERPAVLTVIDEVTAGHVTKKVVGENMAVRIMTGAPIPAGADCIVGQEDTNYGEKTVEVYEEILAGQNYCLEGEDYKKGALLLPADTLLGAAEVGTIASLGKETVRVYRSPLAALITTGDEIILPGKPLGEGQIYDSNLYTLGSRLINWRIPLALRTRAGDDAHLVAEQVKEAAKKADIIISTGGVSVGKKDIMHDVLDLLGCERLFWGISIKPGMPTLCAVYQGKLLICLSGNPYGAAVNLELLVRPLLAKMSGRRDLELRRTKAVTKSSFLKKSFVTRYIRAYYEDGEVSMVDSRANSSGILSSMCGCNCLVEVPAGNEQVKEGETVCVILL